MRLALGNHENSKLEKVECTRSIQAIVFDLDGTLVDSHELVFRSFQYAVSDFGVRITLEEIERIRSNPSSDLFSSLVGKKNAEIALQKLRENSLKTAAQVKLFPGIREVLQILHSKNIPMAVWTARDVPSAFEILKTNNVAHFFKGIVGSCELENNKPHPEGLIKISKLHLEVSVENILMIGDLTHDIMAAKKVGSFSGAAAWHPGNADSLIKEQPDLVFNTISAFGAWIGLLNLTDSLRNSMIKPIR